MSLARMEADTLASMGNAERREVESDEDKEGDESEVDDEEEEEEKGEEEG